MWKDGTENGYYWQIKVFEKGSEFGIDGGKISKLFIRDSDRNVLANYDRGWDIEPSEEIAPLIDYLMMMYN